MQIGLFDPFKRVILVFVIFLAGCNAGSKAKEAIDVLDGVPRKQIDTSILGVNAFVNDSRFGTINEQFIDIRDNLGIKHVRILLAWNEQVQPSPSAEPDFSFYDQIVDQIPSGVDALAVVTGVPAWVDNPANWVGGTARTTFIEGWLKKVLARYGGAGRIVGFEVWNEPDMSADSDNITLDVLDKPANFVELMALANNALDQLAPGKLLVSGATTALNQSFPETLDYNRALRDAGMDALVDIWAIHYYGQQFENVIRNGGVQDFLSGVSKPIWVTESGAAGVDKQLEYAERTWPFITEKISGITRIYQYQYAEAKSPDSTYGLRNLDPGRPVSDLYVHLRER